MDKAETLRLLDAYIRIPTISSEITAETVKATQNFWRGLGLEFELLWGEAPPKGKVHNPALFTEVKADKPNAPTILLYGHWDVQPVGEVADWRWQGQPCPPFEPTYFLDDTLVGSTPEQAIAQVSHDKLEEVVLVARGAADNKGQHLANILGVLQAKAAGRLQWNVKIILDGEEEVGSPNLGAIVEAHAEKLQADFMVGSDGPKSDNRPTLLLGVRGLLAVVVRARNSSGRMLHSGNYGNIVPNPVLPLAQLLQTMTEAVQELGRASDTFRQEVEKHFGDAPVADRARYTPFLRPTLNINSFLTEGAPAPQMRTIIPGWAETTIDVRLTPGMVPQEIYATLEKLVTQANERSEDTGISFSIEQRSACAASYTSPEREGFAWLKQVAETFWQEDMRIIPLLGGTLPNDVFTDGLKLASYWLPAANSNNRQHDTNEHFVLEHFFRQQEFYATLAATEYK